MSTVLLLYVCSRAAHRYAIFDRFCLQIKSKLRPSDMHYDAASKALGTIDALLAKARENGTYTSPVQPIASAYRYHPFGVATSASAFVVQAVCILCLCLCVHVCVCVCVCVCACDDDD